jgi:iron complex outermembrane receptor protein
MRHRPAPRSGEPMIKPLTAAVAAVLGSSWALAPAWAQPSADARSGALEEITVTASRRETTVQELPFNIMAVSGETLEARRLTSLPEFSRWVPGLSVVDQGTRGADLMTVRGLNVLSLDASEYLDNSSGDTVATYLGEIPLYIDYKMNDIDRVEVLIGPQGTLYGAGTLGGAVRYIPRAPDTDAFSFELHGDAYSLSESESMGSQGGVVVNVPINDGTLAFRGSFTYLDDPGFVDYPYLVREPGVSDPQPDLNDPAAVAANLYRVDDANYEQTASSHVALLWKPSRSVQATFNYYYQDQDVGGRTINHRDAFGTGQYESAHRFLEPQERQNDLFSAEIVADLGFAELTSATGVSSFDSHGQRDQTDLLLGFEYGYEDFPAFAAFTREIASEDRLDQELRLVSTSTGPISWIGGLFYNDYDFDASSEEFVPGTPEFFGLSLPTGDLEYRQLSRETVTETAMYGEISYRLGDRWSVTAGGRWFSFDDDQSVSFEIPLVDLANAQANTASDDGFLGKFNASLTVNDHVTAYATLSQGYRIGGVNSVPACLDPLPAGQNICALPDEVLIKPDRTTNLEFGVHGSINDGRLLLNAAVYTIDWQDIQTMSTTQNGGIPITVNGGSARSDGLELSFQSRGEGPWSFAGSYAYNRAQLTSDAPGLVDGADAFSGDRLSGTPEHQVGFDVSYRRALRSGWRLDADYGLTTTTDVITKVGLRNNGERLGGYTVHHASLGLTKDHWSASLYGDNLFNKFAETSVRGDPSDIRDVNGFRLRRYYRNVLRPRTIGIEFRYRLGE